MAAPNLIIDLTQRPPRGFRVRLGGLVILPRMLDKGRATLAGKNGDYEYLTSIDEHLVRFLEFDPDALLKELATGKGDWEILQWIKANSKSPRQPWEIEAFSSFMERYAPDSDPETLAVFQETTSRLGSRFWNSTTTLVTVERHSRDDPMRNDLRD
jgi:hypothetical protein